LAISQNKTFETGRRQTPRAQDEAPRFRSFDSRQKRPLTQDDNLLRGGFTPRSQEIYMASTVWKGQLNFGFVSMPVKFTSAAVKQSISFNQVHECKQSAKSKQIGEPGHREIGKSGQQEDRGPMQWARCKQKMYCEAEGKDLARADIVKGYEYEDGKYVTLTEAEIKAVQPDTAESMDVLEFVHAGEVDPAFFEGSYHLAPEVGGERAYALLYAAMLKTRMVAVTKLAMHQREHVAILRPGARGIVLQTLYYHDEVRMIQEFRTDCGLVKPAEVAMARELVKRMTADWKPEKYSDGYRAKLKELVDSKISGKALESAAKNGRKAAPSNVVDITEALKRSMKQARKKAVSS
jgi:DNA end-binding protein Ku